MKRCRGTQGMPAKRMVVCAAICSAAIATRAGASPINWELAWVTYTASNPEEYAGDESHTLGHDASISFESWWHCFSGTALAGDNGPRTLKARIEAYMEGGVWGGFTRGSVFAEAGQTWRLSLDHPARVRVTYSIQASVSNSCPNYGDVKIEVAADKVYEAHGNGVLPSQVIAEFDYYPPAPRDFSMSIKCSVGMYAEGYLPDLACTYIADVRVSAAVTETPISVAPSVSTLAVTDLKARSAVLQGYLDEDGGEACQCRFRYRRFDGQYNYTPWIGPVSKGMGFGQVINELDRGCTYYFQAQAKNSAGVSAWGDDLDFMTAPVILKRFEINQCFQEVEAKEGGRTNEGDPDEGDPNEQVEQKYKLIAQKPFVVLIELQDVAQCEWSRKVSVELQIVEGKSGKEIHRFPTVRDSVPKGGTLVLPRFRCTVKEGAMGITVGMCGFTIVVHDTERDNKGILTRTLHYPFYEPAPTIVLAVPIRYEGKIGRWNDSWYAGFAQRVFPANQSSFKVIPVDYPIDWPRADSRADELSELFAAMTRLLDGAVAGYAAGAGVTSGTGRAPDIIALGLFPGEAIPQDKKACQTPVIGECRSDKDSVVLTLAVFRESDPQNTADERVQRTLAHEIGHYLGLGEEYVATVPNCDSSAPWVLQQRFNFSTNRPPLVERATGAFMWNGQRYAGVIGEGCFPFGPKHLDCNECEDGTKYYVWCDGNKVGKGGYDVQADTPIRPYERRTVMSSGPRAAWIDGREYEALINRLVANGPTGTVATSARDLLAISGAGTTVMARGSVNIADNTGRLGPIVPIENLPLTLEVPESDYQLVFRSDGGVVLNAFHFEPGRSEYDDATDLYFLLVVDIPPGTSSIGLVVGGREVDEFVRSPASPVVHVESPNGGEMVSGQLPIAWSASDSDSTNLTYTVEYSHDNGQHWDMIAFEEREQQFVVDTNELPGGTQCLVKVTASDGWNRSEDTTDTPFSVPTKPPTVTIVYPADGAIFVGSDGLQGECIARDPETGQIVDPQALVWSSDIDGFLGYGSLLGFELSLGPHTLTVTATDRERKTATDHVGVVVVANRRDFNGDQQIDSRDLLRLAQNWLADCRDAAGCRETDLNRDGKISLPDFAVLAEDWHPPSIKPLWLRSLAAYWTFDEGSGTVAADIAGGNDAQVRGATWTSGLIGGASQFNGDYAFVDCGKAPVLAPPVGTVCFWVQPWAQYCPRSLLRKSGSGVHKKELDISLSSMGLPIYTFGNGCTSVTVNAPAGLPTNQWSHVAVRRDGAEAVIYVNGVKGVSASYRFAPADNGLNLILGGGRTSEAFLGKLDDLRIYDKPLTTEEIQELYKQGAL